MKYKLFIGLTLLLAACLDNGFVSVQDQLDKDIKTIDNYLATNGISAIKDASGVRIAVSQLGTAGLPPNFANSIKVNYTGKLLSNGAIFDEGTDTGILPDYILGWQIGLSLLPEGTIATLYIPSGLAYGTSGAGSIPPNANLVFDVELESVSNTTTQSNRLESDIEMIDTYLTEHEITAVEHPSGLRYVITESGTGPVPSWFSQIKVKGIGKLLSTGVEFVNTTTEPSSEFSSRVVNYIGGFQVGLQLLPEGSKATFYIPSGLGYGAQVVGTIPANSVLIYEVELLDVIN